MLLSAYSNPRAAVITRSAGRGWQSIPRPWTLERIAETVHDPTQIVGIRPEGRVRLVVVDIDRKPERVSPYWHPYGQGRELLALEREAEAAGCTFTLVRSSTSGGLHGYIALPEAVPVWQAYWIGLELISRAGMEEAPGQAELFPSRINYSASPNPADWGQSHGFRLPGQEGSALLVGHRTAEDTQLIYEELLEATEATEAAAGWEELLEAATARRKAAKTEQGHHRPRTATKRPHGVRWTGRGQSNDLMGRITTWARAAHPEARTVEALAPIIAAAARSAPGFTEHASDLSQKDLEAWARRWAACSLRRDRAPGAPAPATDKHHNRSLFLRTRAALTKLWREVQQAGRSFSQRAVADHTGLNRKTVRHHWSFWLQLLSGPYPSLTGGAALVVGCPESQSLDPVPPAAPAETVTVGASTEPETPPPRPDPVSPRSRRHRAWLVAPSTDQSGQNPFKPDAMPADSWRERQRRELLAFIGAT